MGVVVILSLGEAEYRADRHIASRSDISLA